MKRYKTYSNVLNAKLLADQQMEAANNLQNTEDTYKMIQNPQQVVIQQQPQVQSQPQQPQQPQQRYSYRIYRNDVQQDIGWRVMGVFSACVV